MSAEKAPAPGAWQDSSSESASAAGLALDCLAHISQQLASIDSHLASLEDLVLAFAEADELTVADDDDDADDES